MNKGDFQFASVIFQAL